MKIDLGEMLGAKVPGHGYQGQLKFVNYENDVPHDAHCLITLPAISSHTISDFVSAVIDTGDHEYDFTAEMRAALGGLSSIFIYFSGETSFRPNSMFQKPQ